MSATAETASETTSVASPAGPWIYGRWLDLLVGCGAWSAPLLAVTAWLSPSHTHTWVVAFYFLAIVFNYPHFMATIYRAYRTREDFQKYKFFTLHLTVLLAITGILLHTSYRLLPGVFTPEYLLEPVALRGDRTMASLKVRFVHVHAAGNTRKSESRWLRAAFISSLFGCY